MTGPAALKTLRFRHESTRELAGAGRSLRARLLVCMSAAAAWDPMSAASTAAGWQLRLLTLKVPLWHLGFPVAAASMIHVTLGVPAAVDLKVRL